MNGNRFFSILMLGLVWLTTQATSPAIDVNPSSSSPGSEANEASVFFTHLMNTSNNAVIAGMARESLLKLKMDQSPALQARTAKKTTEVKLLPQSDHTFVVPAVVNRKTVATFLVDTGASYTVITPRMAENLGIIVTTESQMVPVTTANGILQAPVVRLKHVSLGGMQVDNVDAVITDLGETTQISGLLGMSFFQGMEMSFKQDKLVLSR